MKRFLLRVCLFLTLMPLGWAILFAMAMMNSGVESWFIAKDRNWGFVNAKSLEWSRLRHSHSFDVFDVTRAFEARDMSLFYFCSSAQSIPHSLPLIEAAFEDQTPEVLLLDVYPAIWDKETVSSEPVRDWIVNGSWDAHTTATLVRPFCLDDYALLPVSANVVACRKERARRPQRTLQRTRVRFHWLSLTYLR